MPRLTANQILEEYDRKESKKRNANKKIPIEISRLIWKNVMEESLKQIKEINRIDMISGIGETATYSTEYCLCKCDKCHYYKFEGGLGCNCHWKMVNNNKIEEKEFWSDNIDNFDKWFEASDEYCKTENYCW